MAHTLTPDGAGYVGPRHRWRVAKLAGALLADVPPGLIVDAGCGRGSLALAVAAEGRVVLAFDRDLAGVAAARARAVAQGCGARVFVCVADVTALPLREGLVAGIAAGEVLEHVADDAGAAAELARVLTEDGVLAVTVPAGPGRLGPTDRAAGHWRRYDRAGLTRLFTDAGLVVAEVTGWGFPFGRLYDRLVLAPAMAARGRPAGRGLLRVGRWRFVDDVWRRLFDLDDRIGADERGSGWLAVGRKAPYANSSSTGMRQPGTAGSASAISPRQ
jgi:SAM-dependent methyltransferase